MKPLRVALLGVAIPLLFSFGCSSSDDSSSGNATGPAGGPVSGAADSHCGSTVVTVDPSTCNGDMGEGGAADEGDGDSAGGESAGGAADCNQTHDAEYGDTLYGSEGDDDDCKYHAAWTSTPIRLNQDVTLTLTASDLATQMPLAALADGKIPLTRLDVYEPCSPNRRGPDQNFNLTIKQTSPGMFTAGPVKFDQSGRWVVRFHLYEECVDGDVSPHGHIAFFVDVP